MVDSAHKGAVSPGILDSDAVIRWEVVRKDPLVSRHVLARLLPHAIESAEQLHEIIDDERRAVPLLAAIAFIVAKTLAVLVRLALVILSVFGMIWFVADLVDHPVILSRVAYGLAAYFTAAAGYQAIRYLLSVTESSRQRFAREVKRRGLFAMPLLMYATACPTTTAFIDGVQQGPPSLLSWLGFFGYMFADVVSLGVPQALFGELASFQPPSLAAAANTLWAKSLMTFAVAGTVVSTIGRLIATRQTFVGTVDELREWLAVQFPGQDQSYLVRPLALERAFPSPDEGVPIEIVRDHEGLIAKVSDPWRVDARGRFVHPFGEGQDYEKVRKSAMSLFGMSHQVYSTFNKEEVKAKRRTKHREELGMALFCLYKTAVPFLPSALFVWWLGYSVIEAGAVALLVTVLTLTLSRLVDQRYVRELLVDLLHCKAAALTGTDARRERRFRALERKVQCLNRDVFFFKAGPLPTSLEELLHSSPSYSMPSYFDLVAFPGSSEIWLMHSLPFHLQGKMVKAVYQQQTRTVVFYGGDGSEEEFDFLGAPVADKLNEHLYTCNKLTLLHCPGSCPPRTPLHVQEVPLTTLTPPRTMPVSDSRRHYGEMLHPRGSGQV